MQSLWMLAAGLAFALMGVFVKIASGHFATAELVFWRAIVQTAVAWALLRHAGMPVRTPRLGMHVHRGVAGFVSLFMFFHALTALPVATAMTLNYSSPLFLAILLAVLARERPDAKLVGTVLLGFVGVVLLLQPTFEADQWWPGLIGLVSGAISAVALAALAFAGIALAATQGDSYKVSAALKARTEVPRPTGVPAGATGSFTGTTVELANDKAKVTWKLTFSHLSGKAIAAHIHLGKKGKAGPVALALCGPCRSGQKGSGLLAHAQFARVEAGTAYVNVHTTKNAGGEIRGQLKATETASGGGSDDPAPPPSDPGDPNPYP